MKNRTALLGLLLFCFAGCQERVVEELKKYPDIFPDYRFTTLPVNIAPLVFEIEGKDRIEVEYRSGDELLLRVKGGETALPSERKWKKMLQRVAGSQLSVQVTARDATQRKWYRYKPFYINVSTDPIDSHIAYRLIEPGYELWVEMGLYQRDLTSFTEKPIVENKLTDNSCLNCHSFCNYSPDRFQFHSRQNNPGTILIEERLGKRLNLKTDSTISGGVYPFWHPSGDFIAYSVNTTRQLFHAYNRNKIEVYDEVSDLILYDVKRNEIVTDDRLQGPEFLETYPAWSPDGKWLYFCRAVPVDIYFTPWKLKYGIYRVAFDAENRKFGPEIETIVDPAETNRTQLFPRISPDGRFLMYSEASYGYFTIWHKEADLKVIDLETRQPVSTAALNSRDVESYHAWSSNGRWVVFSSRRLDGLYTRLFIAHCNENGVFSKPFLLPQKDPKQNQMLMKSYNIPEFITGEITVSPYELEKVVRGEVTQATLADPATANRPAL